MADTFDLQGQVLGQYELQELVGIGGMGAVYRGYQAALTRDVAIKVLPPGIAEDDASQANFIREARIAASLEHPNIVPIYDYGSAEVEATRLSFVVMRYLDHGSLLDRLRQQAQDGSALPSLDEISGLLKQIGSALDYAHRRRVVHQDIKPGNIMFEDETIYLVDFGIARLIDETAYAQQQVFGTPLYMAPEHWLRDPLTPATDQYALAVIAYMLVAGRAPFDGTTSLEIMRAHLRMPLMPVSKLRPSLPPSLDDVLARALSKQPRDRFPSVGDFATAFAAAAESAPTRPTPVVRTSELPPAVPLPETVRNAFNDLFGSLQTSQHLPRVTDPIAPPLPQTVPSPVPPLARDGRTIVRWGILIGFVATLIAGVVAAVIALGGG